MVEIAKYSPEYKDAWNAFVAASKNGTFLFDRDYMDYHADRFTDHSLLFYNKGKVVALLPANVDASEVHAHSGLSYGGVVSGADMKAQLMLDIFDALLLYFRELGFVSINYKAIPHIYHQLPADEDLYALFRNKAILYRRDLNSVVMLSNKLPYNMLRKRRLKQSAISDLELGESQEYEKFLNISQRILTDKYNTLPVHSAAELSLLASRFPENIKLHTATQNNKLLAGILIFETITTAHCQYIASTPEGQNLGALDLLTHHLITNLYAHKLYFSFGVSTEQQGRFLNENLIRNKESYGARSIVQDFYKISL